MQINEKIKNEIVSLLKKQKINIAAADLETPPSLEMGDFALPCFSMAKELKKSPVEIARDLASQLKPQGLIINLKAIGPYLNFIIDISQVAELALKEILKAKIKEIEGRKRREKRERDEAKNQ